MPGIRDQIRDVACGIIKAHPGGIRFTPLKAEIRVILPDANPHTIDGSIWDLEKTRAQQVAKPERGVYAPVGGEPLPPGPPPPSIRESDFYEPFADYLRGVLEATVAVPLGGSIQRSKWGTPDVIGAYKRSGEDLVPFPGELLAAEIKIDPGAYVEAFGQAVAYRLFAARTYIVMPKTMTDADQERLDALCMLFGVGFVLFDLDKDNPNWEIRARAQRFPPDMFYVNKFAELLKSGNKGAFNIIFPLT